MTVKDKNILWTTLRISGMAIAMLIVLVLLTGIFWGSRHFVVRRHVIFYETLPAKFDGYRILQFSDLHAGTFRRKDLHRVVNLINQQHCDMVVFTGDMVNRKSAEMEEVKSILAHIQAPDGVFSVLGNHDYGTYDGMSEEEQKKDVERLVQCQRSIGWHPLLNDHAVVRRGNESIVISGVECFGAPPFPRRGDMYKALKGVKKNDFIVLLSHDPCHWHMQIIPETSVQLTLSGHTHAAQFKVGDWSPIQWHYREWSGIYVRDTKVLNVSDGLGGYIGPFRFGAWPEVAVITLRCLPKSFTKK